MTVRDKETKFYNSDPGGSSFTFHFSHNRKIWSKILF